jgi:hypothetical protein
MIEDVIKRLRRRAHVHDVYYCYGTYEPCGEHHVHDDKCGGRDLVCRMSEDKDLVELLAEFDRMRKELVHANERDQHEQRARNIASDRGNADQRGR